MQSSGVLVCKCILMGGDVWESVFLLQMCVQVLCMLAQKVVRGAVCDWVLRMFEVRCVICWGSV